MITKNKKPSMSVLRKISIVPVAMIALCAFSLRPAETPPSSVTRSLSEPAQQDPWMPINEMEEQIIVVGYGPKNDSLQTKPRTDITVVSDSERKIAPGAFSYDDVEQKPVFQDSIRGYIKFLGERIKYPARAQENGIVGKVVVSYIIDKDGKVTDVKSPVRIDILSNELERLIKSLPDWKPGVHGGKNVPVQCYAFVEFRLQQ